MSWNNIECYYMPYTYVQHNFIISTAYLSVITYRYMVRDTLLFNNVCNIMMWFMTNCYNVFIILQLKKRFSKNLMKWLKVHILVVGYVSVVPYLPNYRIVLNFHGYKFCVFHENWQTIKNYLQKQWSCVPLSHVSIFGEHENLMAK